MNAKQEHPKHTRQRKLKRHYPVQWPVDNPKISYGDFIQIDLRKPSIWADLLCDQMKRTITALLKRKKLSSENLCALGWRLDVIS